ncbi:MAG: uncharacterized protein KVP18_002006 [Porospora cf. gigantea A]|uniref:uncharacterized protein n=1 Tax=Porospora cf. gigantea A TaxID=2853593 RepID=UPI0035597C95|nr:MAG: hypothetical protein KVP18_002006 [Porospora cf. gigantea A]
MEMQTRHSNADGLIAYANFVRIMAESGEGALCVSSGCLGRLTAINENHTDDPKVILATLRALEMLSQDEECAHAIFEQK